MTGIPWLLACTIVRDTFRFFLCAALTGLAIKIMDDWLDISRDRCDGDTPPGPGPDLVSRLGDASLPYALLLFACAVPIDGRTAVALFLMAYAAGMGGASSRDLYPSGLRGWQESVVSALISWVACGWRVTAVAGLCMACIQGFDDVMDYGEGGARAAPLVGRFGIVEVAAVAAAMALLSLALDIPRTAGILTAAVFVWRLESALRKGRRPPGML
ncbi:MAG: hypothetical protein ACM3X4_05600 [Ignavibacteriales bacterium]